jgi:tRNA pseudouridine32 synthase / 23S rRNA pseudouridine746 synthase
LKINAEPHILQEDQEWLAVWKPAHWLSVPSRLGSRDPRPNVGRHLETMLGCTLFPVHRLDEGVEGVLLFAKTPKCHRDLCMWFEGRHVHKTYEAITARQPKPWIHGGEIALNEITFGKNLSIQNKISKGKRRAFVDPKNGKEALSQLTAMHPFSAAAPFLQWRLSPHTGRSHQLRLHMALLGFPILGDHLYGSCYSDSNGCILLRSVSVEFADGLEIAKYNLPRRVFINGYTENEFQTRFVSFSKKV